MHDFLVAELAVPESAASAEGVGLDLDGDGEVDNKLGDILSAIAGQLGEDLRVDDYVRQRIQAGELLLVGRVIVDQWGDDNIIIAQLLQAAVPTGGSSPLFDGHDVVSLDPEAPDDLYLCGHLGNDHIDAGPSDLFTSLPIPELGRLNVTLTRVQLVGRVTADGFADVMIGGGISRQESSGQIYPQVVTWMNAAITADPTGPRTTAMLDWLDGQCDPAVEGCDPAPPGCAADGVVDLDELKCNALLDSALAPDVDIDGDGQKDLISVGLRIVNAVPVTVQ